MSIKRRVFLDKLFSYGCVVVSIIVLIPLFIILIQVAYKGAGQFNWAFFTESQPPPEEPGGGILNALVGTLMIVFTATALSFPISILGGIYMFEHKDSRLGQALYTACNILQSVPAIVIGIASYSWFVKTTGGFSMFSGGLALSIMMLPYMTITTVEIFTLLPKNIWEAAYALGAPYYKVIMRVVLPAGMSGILSGLLISLSRVAGETAPLLFTSFGNPYLSFDPTESIGALPLVIFQYAISPYESWQDIAWGASFLLLLGMILVNLVSKKLSSKSI